MPFLKRPANHGEANLTDIQDYAGVNLVLAYHDGTQWIDIQKQTVPADLGCVIFTDLLYGVTYYIREEPERADGTPVQVREKPKYMRFDSPEDLAAARETGKDSIGREGFDANKLPNVNQNITTAFFYQQQYPVRVKKVSANPMITNTFPEYYSFEGATFTLESKAADKYGHTFKFTFTCDKNGNSNTQYIAPGDYILKETLTPKGYIAIENMNVTIVEQWATQTITVKDPPQMASIELQKQSLNPTVTNNNPAYSLAGARYGVFVDSGCTALYLDMYTDDQGKATVGFIPIGPTLYVKEITASPGFGEDTTVYPFTASTNKQIIPITSYEPFPGKIEIQKSSQLPLISNNNGCYSLAGAVYGIWDNFNLTGAPVATITTDANGYGIATNLPLGTYYVMETQASPGFNLDTTKHAATLTAPTPSVTVSSGEYLKNDPIGIEMTKIWNGETTLPIPTLAGTQFTIRYYDNLAGNTAVAPARTWVIEVKKVGNNNFRAYLQDGYLVAGSSPLYYDEKGRPTLPLGTYSIQETKPAAGYTLEGELKDANGNVVSRNSAPYVTVVADSAGNQAVHLRGGNKYNGFNKPIDTSIRIFKKNLQGNPLSGVQYELKDGKGNVVSVGITDAAGAVHFTHLYPDRYTITELNTPPRIYPPERPDHRGYANQGDGGPGCPI